MQKQLPQDLKHLLQWKQNSRTNQYLSSVCQLMKSFSPMNIFTVDGKLEDLPRGMAMPKY